MRGCLSVIAFLLLLFILLRFPFIVLGIIVTAYGIRMWRIRGQMGRSRKRALLPIIVGVLLFLIGFVFVDSGSNDDRNDVSVVPEEEYGAVYPKPYSEGEREAEQRAQELVESERASRAKKDALLKSMRLEEVTVRAVIDGDTIETEDGERMNVLGVNTPSLDKDMGEQARMYTTAMILGKEVYVQQEKGAVEDTLARFIWLEIPESTKEKQEARDHLFNVQLLRNGYGKPTNNMLNETYEKWFRSFAKEAKENKLGIWKE